MERRRDPRQKGKRDGARHHRDEENLDQPQALPNVTLPRHRFARETEREAPRAARGSPGSRESGEGVAGTSEGTRASRSQREIEKEREANVRVGGEREAEKSHAFSLDGGKIPTRAMETESLG